ncbi:MAG: ATPase, T2SS/T4P/T4SS family [Promethearchaeota archaeon]
MSIIKTKNHVSEILKYLGLNGKNNVRLVMNCNKCMESDNHAFNKKACISCLLHNIYLNVHKKISEISIGSNNEIISSHKVQQLVEYYNKLQKLYKIYLKIDNIQFKKCCYKSFKCKVFPAIKHISKKDFIDPIFVFCYIKEKLAIIQDSNIRDLNCITCTTQIRKLLQILLKSINELELIKNIVLNKSDDMNLDNFYENFFSTNLTSDNNGKKRIEKKSNKKIMDRYTLLIYNIKIFEYNKDPEKKYKIKLFYNSKAEEDFIIKIIEDVLKNISHIKVQSIVKFVDLIEIYKKKANNYINQRYKKLSSEKIEKIALLASLKKIKFEKLFPLLLDDYIEEIFLDSPNDEIYINHQKYGRCLTGIRLSPPEIERIKTFLRIYSGKRLDYNNPILKYVLKNKYFHCRFAIDLDPVHYNDFGFDIRKLNKNILTIQDLLKNKTLNPSMAAFLYFSILKKQNITVTGETDTGKTTLINALDLITPKEFRKIYVESAVESLNQSEYGKHQLKYTVDDLQESSDFKSYSKSNQIKTLLHRSPDTIYLGEILTKEEGEAMFHCLAAGLKGFQTIHSRSVESLMNRIIYFFNIDPSCISDLDLIIFMKKEKNMRRILSIFETNKGDRGKNYINLIYQYEPRNQNWKQTIKHSELDIIKNIRQFEDLNDINLNLFLDIYEEIFRIISDVNKIPVDRLVNIFHKIAFFSLIDYSDLKKYWERIKPHIARYYNF